MNKKLSTANEEIKRLKTALTLVADNSCGVKIECSVCLDNYWDVTTDRKMMSTGCGHIFCVTCLNLTLKPTGPCPKCRQPCSFGDCRPIFFWPLYLSFNKWFNNIAFPLSLSKKGRLIWAILLSANQNQLSFSVEHYKNNFIFLHVILGPQT